MGDIILRTTEMTRQGCQVKTTIRKLPNGALSEDVVLQADDINEPARLQLVEEDTGRWMVAT